MTSHEKHTTPQERADISETPPTINPIDLPSKLLQAAYFVGKNNTAQSTTFYRTPRNDIPPRLPLVVNVHSTRRDAITCRDSLISFADKYGVAILAPLFPAGLDSLFDLDSYQLLRTDFLHADLRLLDMLNEVGHIWPGITTDPIILLVGFSGGGQFVHRFMYLNPERVSAIAIAAPGQVTKLNANEPWPRGISDVDEVFPGEEVNVDAIAQIEDILLLVGEEDAMSDGQVGLLQWLAKRKAKLKGEPVEEKLARTSRVQGVKSLQKDWRKHGIEARLEIVPGVGHSYRDRLPSLIAWLEDCSAIVDRE